MTWRLSMKLSILAAAAVSLAAGVASAAEVKGVIKAVDTTMRTVTVNSLRFAFPPGLNMAGLAVGQTVTITFEDANGTNWVSKVAK
jgi:Cu/Ag efflux protein CusF